MNRHVISAMLVPAALLASLYFANSASAQASKRAKHPAAFRPIVEELRGVRATLQHANRNYKGHRARAVREITAAIRALQGTRGKGIKRKGTKTVPEPQPLSDQQLRNAISVLQGASGQLAALPGKRAAKARGHINRAEKELAVALTIR
jgi:hypothetical protein